MDPARCAPARRPRPPARPGAAARRDRLVHAARRGRLRRGPHRDAGRHRRDGRLVVRLASARPAALPDLAPARPLRNSLEPPARRGAKAHWGAVHHPVEDVGTGASTRGSPSARRPRWACRPTRSTTRAVATIVCGYAGDDRRRVRHSPMVHVFLRDDDGVVLRSRFWLGAVLRPYLPGAARRSARAAPQHPRSCAAGPAGDLPRALARHCAEEYANLAALLPDSDEASP